MTKRPASGPLEDTAAVNSPASKRARVQDVDEGLELPDRSKDSNGNATTITPSSVPNGHERKELDGTRVLLDEEEEEQSAVSAPKRQTAPAEGYGDLYLDTINRAVLDFDFEKLCSVTLSNINVYACLVCGKYYRGRGPKSEAYFHSLDENHHVYINLETKRVYVLPEGYEVTSSSLDDIKYVVDPKFSKEQVLSLDKEVQNSFDLSSKRYSPGFVGMNNIKANDYFNVVCHALAHVPPLRNFFMLEDLSSRPQLAQRFSILVRKIWNPRAFKAHVSPHELLQEVALRSSKRFTLTEQADPVDFLSWFLNNIHLALGGSKSKPGTSIIHRVFQGNLKIESQSITARSDAQDRLRFSDASISTQKSKYLMLTLDLPPAPLFKDSIDKNMIPQIPLSQLLQKYDGLHAQERQNNRLRYRLLHPLPPYLIFHIKRFTTNKFRPSERNPTIVTFNPRALDMAPYIEPSPEHPSGGEPVLYDLVANITHEAVRTRDDSVEGEAERKVWRVQMRDRARDEWVEVQDLFVEGVRAETIFTRESVVQIWERRKFPGKGKAKAS